jgi:hypothetical protein
LLVRVVGAVGCIWPAILQSATFYQKRKVVRRRWFHKGAIWKQ